MKLPAGGGIATKICDLERLPRGGTWSGETIVFAQLEDRLFQVSAGGGVPVPVTELTGKENGHRWPQFLPDGRHFTYMTHELLNKVYIASLDPGEPRRLVAPERGVVTDMVSRAFAFSGIPVDGGARHAAGAATQRERDGPGRRAAIADPGHS